MEVLLAPQTARLRLKPLSSLPALLHLLVLPVLHFLFLLVPPPRQQPLLTPLEQALPHQHLLGLLHPALPFLARLVLMAMLVLQDPLCQLVRYHGLREDLPVLEGFRMQDHQDSVPYLALLIPLLLQLLVLPALAPSPEVLLPREHLVPLEVLIPRLLLAGPLLFLVAVLLDLPFPRLEEVVPLQVLVHLLVLALVALLPPRLEVQGSRDLLVPLEVLVLLPVGVWTRLWLPQPLQWLR